MTLPILHHPSPPPPLEGWPRSLYTPEQLALLDDLALRIAPTVASETHAEEKAWADDACLLRYLRAVKWDVSTAATRLQATIAWRHETKPDRIPPDEVEEEAIHGKEFVSGFDNLGRPLVYLVPKKEHTKTYDRQLRYVVYNIERAIKAMPPGVEALDLLVDYDGVSITTSPPVSQAKRVLDILGNHYPERLGTAFVFNPTCLLTGLLFQLIGPFLDPVTKSKIHFVDLKKLKKIDAAQAASSDSLDNKSYKEAVGMGGWTDPRRYIAPEMLSAEYGGAHSFVYDHKIYWPAVTAP
ncbi:hypothetical protein HKX48_000183 [Thoreauomyces humboldtii]|nr:hypothetical protein HKX48_000183 [Thoreauomyces humboldtii]